MPFSDGSVWPGWRIENAVDGGSHVGITSGNLARRGVGDVDTLTVAEYMARPDARRT